MEQNSQTEYLVSEWIEPTSAHPSLSPRAGVTLIAGGSLLLALCITLGYVLDETSLYFASVVICMAVVALFVQSKRTTPLKQITITNQRIGVDTREIALSELAGFWLETTPDGLVINLENKRPTLLPASFFFANNEKETAKKVLLQVLPELEPRTSHFTDRFSHYFRI